MNRGGFRTGAPGIAGPCFAGYAGSAPTMGGDYDRFNAIYPDLAPKTICPIKYPIFFSTGVTGIANLAAFSTDALPMPGINKMVENFTPVAEQFLAVISTPNRFRRPARKPEI